MYLYSIPLACVIDLTGTAITNGKYYYGERISKEYGLKYDKIQVQGHGNLPERWQLDRFNSIMEQYTNYVNGKVFKRTFPAYDHPDATPPTVLVHCTHGVNRTGYFIGNYLIEEHAFPMQKALSLFEKMRGHSVKYGAYREDLKAKELIYFKQRLVREMPTQVPLPLSSDTDDDLYGDVIMSSSSNNSVSSDSENDSEETKERKKIKREKQKSGATHVIFLSSTSESSDSEGSLDSYGRSKKKKKKSKRSRSKSRKSKDRFRGSQSRISRDRHGNIKKLRKSRDRKSRDRRSKSRDRRSKSRDRKSKDRQSNPRDFGPRSYTIIRKSQSRCYNTYNRKSKTRHEADDNMAISKPKIQPEQGTHGPMAPSFAQAQEIAIRKRLEEKRLVAEEEQKKRDWQREKARERDSRVDNGPYRDHWDQRSNRDHRRNEPYYPGGQRSNSSHQTRSTDRSNNYQDRRSNNRYQRRDRDNQKTNWDKPNSPEIEDITPQQSTQEMTEKFKQKSQLTGQGSTENPLTSEPLTVKNWGDLKRTLRVQSANRLLLRFMYVHSFLEMGTI